MAIAQIIGGLLGGAGSLFGGISEAQARQQREEALARLQTIGLGQQTEGRQQYMDNAGDLRRENNTLLNQFRELLMGPEGNSGQMAELQRLTQMLGPEGLMQLLSDPMGRGITPQMSSLIDAMGGGDGLQNLLETAYNNAGAGRDNRGGLFDRANELANGAGGSLTQEDVGNELLSGRGVTGFNQGLQDRAGEMINRGGMTDALNFAQGGALDLLANQGQTADTRFNVGAGQDIINAGGATADQQRIFQQAARDFENGGATAGTNALTGAGLDLLSRGGQTDASRYLVNRGQELSAENPLLSMEDTISFARDSAGRAAKDRAEAARRQALSRGGGAGSTVFSGQQADGLYEFGDEMAEAEAKAMQDALTQRQGLGLQQLAQGAGMVGQGGSLENQTLGIGSSLAQGGEGIAAGRYGTAGSTGNSSQQGTTTRLNTGFGATQDALSLETNRLLQSLGILPQVNNAAAGNVGTYGNLGLGGSSDQVSRMGAGSNFLTSGINSRLNAAQTAGGIQNDSDRVALENNNLARLLMGDQRSATGNQFNSLLAGGQFGNLLNQSDVQASQAGLQNNQAYTNTLMQQLAAAMGGVQNLANMGIDWARIGAGQASGAVPTGQNTNPWGGILQGAGTFLSQIPNFGGQTPRTPSIPNAPGTQVGM